MNDTSSSAQAASWPLRIAAAWILALVALALAGWTGEWLETSFGITGRARQGFHALIMSGIVLPGIWVLRTRFDRRPLEGLGLPGSAVALKQFLLGAGLILAPMLVTLALTSVFGWATIELKLSASGLGALAAGIATVFFFEALPEELVFRGYIYRNLSNRYRRWVAAVGTVVLFVLLPCMLFPIQKYVLGMNATLGGSESLSASYVIMMFIFGSFVQYLRVLTGTVWTGIGFHAMFVLMNRIMSPRPSSFIQFTDVVSGQALQLAQLSCLLLVVVSIVIHPRIAGRRPGWRDLDPEPTDRVTVV